MEYFKCKANGIDSNVKNQKHSPVLFPARSFEIYRVVELIECQHYVYLKWQYMKYCVENNALFKTWK